MRLILSITQLGIYAFQEIKKILQGLSGLKVVGADIVEVAPDYDTQGGQAPSLPPYDISHPLIRRSADEITSIAAANIGHDMLTLMAQAPLVE